MTSDDTFNGRPLPYFPAALFNQRHIAELAVGDSLCLLARHAAIDQVRDLFIEVLADRLGEFVALALTREKLFEPIHNRLLFASQRFDRINGGRAMSRNKARKQGCNCEQSSHRTQNRSVPGLDIEKKAAQQHSSCYRT